MLQGAHQGAAVRQQSKLVHVWLLCKGSNHPFPTLLSPFSLLPFHILSLIPQVCSVYVWFWWGRESDHFAVCPWISPEVYQLLAEGKLMSITRHTMWFKQHLYGQDCLVLRPSWVQGLNVILTFCTWHAPILLSLRLSHSSGSGNMSVWFLEIHDLAFCLATAGSQNMSNLLCWSSSIAVETVYNLRQTYHL